MAFGTIPSGALAYCVGWDKTLSNYGPHYYSVAHEYRRAEWVIKAKVLKETWVGEDGKEKSLTPPFQNGSPRPWGFDPYAGAFYDLQVERLFNRVRKKSMFLRRFKIKTESYEIQNGFKRSPCGPFSATC